MNLPNAVARAITETTLIAIDRDERRLLHDAAEFVDFEGDPPEWPPTMRQHFAQMLRAMADRPGIVGLIGASAQPINDGADAPRETT